MPYQYLQELPKGVTRNLPKHAQEIYKEAFNSAWQQYKNPDKRRDDAGRETTAHRVAWGAVERKYGKNKQGTWVKRHG